jgi:hypothetical protein
LNLAAAVPPAIDPFTDTVPREAVAPKLRVIARDPRVQLSMHEPVTIMSDDGRQPYLFCTAKGTLLVQAQLRARAFDTKGKYVYHYRIGTMISRDGGATWNRFTAQEGHDDVYTEGGIHQEPDGTILMLDTFVMPGKQPDHGVGELWKSHDDLHTWEGPFAVDFTLPGIRFGAGSDDRGVPLPAAWMHRSMIALPNGDLLTTMYSWFTGDTAPCAYMPSMPKARSVLIRSRDHGATWAYESTIAVDGAIGTEGFVEPVLLRVAQGPHAGRLLCYMRTGRELYGARSDDSGATWSQPFPVRIPGIDVYRTDLWAHYFVDPKAPGYLPTDQLYGSEVDPDLIQMGNGTLVCAVGVRIPQRKYRENWHVPQNGDYLAFSCDGGDTWSQVVQFTSGAPTTQYMGIREIAPDVLYVAYDDSVWKMPGRAVGFRLEVHRTDR